MLDCISFAEGLPSLEAFKSLVARANDGSAQALGELRGMLDQHATIWQTIGDLGGTLEATLIDKLAAGDTLIRESLVRRTATMRAEIGAEGAPAIEQLAIDRVIVAWLHIQQAEKEFQTTEPDTKQGRFYWKRKGQADRAYEASLKTLASLRKLRPKVRK